MNDNLLLQDCLDGKVMAPRVGRWKLKEKRGHVRWTNYQTMEYIYIFLQIHFYEKIIE